MGYFTNKKRACIFLLLVLLVNLSVLADYLMNREEYTFYCRCRTGTVPSVEVSIEDEDVLEYRGISQEDGYLGVNFRAKSRGMTDVEVMIAIDEAQPITYCLSFRVNRIHTIIRGNRSDYNHWQVVLLGRGITMVLLCAFFMMEYIQRIKENLYSYRTLQTGGMAFFCLGLCVLLLLFGLIFGLNFRDYNAETAFSLGNYIFLFFIMGTVPFVLIFAVALSISNIRLIMREGFRKVNLLGIALSLMVVAGMTVCIIVPFLENITNRFSYEVYINVQLGISAVFCFLLAYMLSTMICGLVAAKRVPEFDKDFIIILGCGVREDGTLYPLLQGRVDRAIWFWQKQYEQTGKRAVFVPSGGKGSDEPIAEGEAMKRYLLSKGIPEECIISETGSVSTLQNMQFSKQIIEKEKTDAKILFSTTNYHVFRSGIFAEKAGLRAEGIGSRTRWYFWPNAFVREFIGLLYSARRFELAFFGALAVISMIVGRMS